VDRAEPPAADALTEDERLAERWERGERLERAITHEEHLRIAWVLLRRHGREAGSRRLLEGTRRACEVHGVPERFDADLTARWSGAIADALEQRPAPGSLAELLERHPELRDGGRFGGPTAGRRPR